MSVPNNIEWSGDSSTKARHEQLPTPSLSPAAVPTPLMEDVDKDAIPSLGGKENKAPKSTVTGLGISDGVQDQRGRSHTSPASAQSESDRKLVLSPAQIYDLTSSPTSIPFRAATPTTENIPVLEDALSRTGDSFADDEDDATTGVRPAQPRQTAYAINDGGMTKPGQFKRRDTGLTLSIPTVKSTPGSARAAKLSSATPRTASTPPVQRRISSAKSVHGGGDGVVRRKQERVPSTQDLDEAKHVDQNGSATQKPASHHDGISSPISSAIPLPPFSLPTYLQLELASEKPSPLYIYRSANTDAVYESTKAKFERLWNFLILPFELEAVLYFGALACLDAWLYTFTILPLRFLRAISILLHWWSNNLLKEVIDLANFVYQGFWRLHARYSGRDVPGSPLPPDDAPRSRRASAAHLSSPEVPPFQKINGNSGHAFSEQQRRRGRLRHRRTRSTPSLLQSSHKADILHGILIIISCMILMRFDASRMYHSVRGQAAIKLYVIYNVLEVLDRLLGALGQDVLECLFSPDTLERNSYGRSKIIRPFWMFVLALIYNVGHATALFYQVITLNVAVNSYSNALLTLLMSNQFVEIKGTVFKKFEKENLFQLTCADVVERFQLWLMLLIIALRNIVELGGLSVTSASDGASRSSTASAANTTAGAFRSTSILPKSFTLLPQMTGQVLGPFLIVLGSEMVVDWVKHAYITKFNNTKPNIYSRFLDVLAKDYYSHAFTDQNLNKRLGLPVLPLACLFIRAIMQTYHMFIATHVPPPLPSPATSLAESASEASPATTAVLEHIDQIFRRALGRSSFGAGVGDSSSNFNWWSIDDLIAFTTMIVVFLVAYCVLLALKLVLGMCLLSYARRRYKRMREREQVSFDAAGRRVGGWGAVEVDEEKRKWIYRDDPEGLEALRKKEREKKEGKGREVDLERVERYTMVAKRIW